MRRRLLVLLELLVLLSSGDSAQTRYACDGSINASFPFCDAELGIDARVQDLVSRLNLDEKLGQMGNSAPSIPRLGIPGYQWWQEALHGVASSPGVAFGGSAPAATSFPMPITTAASFNTSLFNKIGQAVSTEARALYNLGRSGLTFWSPNVNIFRDPRWGRGQETPGEDPLLSSKYAIYFVRGLQEGEYQGPEQEKEQKLEDFPIRISACCKHLTAYDVDNWKGMDRYHFNAEVSQQDLMDTFNPPFQSCIEQGRVTSVMCSYNRVNGVPTCADQSLLTNKVRSEWGFNGYIVSDCDALQVFYEDTSYAPSAEDAVADSVLAGLDLNCGSFLAKHALAAVRAGKIPESEIDRAVSSLFRTRMRLGLFNGPSEPHSELGAGDICNEDHQQLALDAALQGIVLLKNDGSLPFSSRSVKTLALIGPNANATRTMLGNYEGVPCRVVSPLQGLQAHSSVLYSPGCSDVACTSSTLIPSALHIAGVADAVVLVVGLDESQEAETLDRTSLLLPGEQSQLIRAVTDSVTCPVILVVMSAGPVDISLFKDDPKISSILWIGYPGQAGGAALAQVLFGEYNPGGRLPVTWYPEEFTRVSMLDMRMRPDPRAGYPGRTYRFYTGSTLFNFGHGLSYTGFSYSFISAPNRLQLSDRERDSSYCLSGWQDGSACYHSVETLKASETCERLNFQVKVAVRNDGIIPGGHSVLIYWAPPATELSGGGIGFNNNPRKQLIGFRKVSLGAGSQREMVFGVEGCRDLSTAHRSGKRVFHVGEHQLIIGTAVHRIYID